MLASLQCVVKGIPIHYEVSGSGRPVVVLHGSPLDSRSMKACLEPIFSSRKGWSRIYLDLPGHGKTPGPDWIKNNDQMLEVVIDFLDTIVPGQHFAIIGESYGGYLARGVVHHLSARIDGLFLWTPATYPRSERKLPTRVVRVRNDQLAAGLTSEPERDMFGLLIFQTKEAMDFARAHIIPGWEIVDEKFVERVDDTKFTFDLGSQRFEKPTLIICGRQDSVVGYEDAFETSKNYPMGTIVIVDGAGHALGFTEGEHLFRASVDAWLDSLEEPQS